MRNDPALKVAVWLVASAFLPVLAILMIFIEPKASIFWYLLLCFGVFGLFISFWAYQGYSNPEKYFTDDFMPSEANLAKKMIRWAVPAGLIAYGVIKLLG